ncbi:MAG: MBOAT family O-acyltransferase [Lachnospiraceae bacterium]|jgi:alginate O-acetyltransferase complex protein AlgI
MIFSSLTFLCVFLPIVFLLYLCAPGIRAKNILLIAASLLFYAYGEPVYVFLMLFCTFGNYLLALLVSRVKGRKLWLALAVTGNLCMLGVFKYSGFLVTQINAVFSLELPVPEITLPIGISFFTFQAMSYVIDVYQGKVEGERNFGRILLYISFFPQLIAGPIVKYHDISREISDRKQTMQGISLGIRRFVLGLSKKVLIANTMGRVADAVFTAQIESVNILAAWIGALAYLLQIYYDFSGYSDMAIGLGRMFGFHFKENFRYPYSAVSIKDFWRRWHMSLSGWFREYLYFPLGGNRKGRARTCLNKIIVFFCTGFWHGANLTFIFWGLYHGFFLLLEEYLPKPKRIPGFLKHIYALLVVCVGFVIFRAETLSQGFAMIGRMFSGFDFSAAAVSFALQQCTPLVITVFVLGAIGSMPVLPAFQAKIGKQKGYVWEPVSFVVSLGLLVLCMLSLSGGGYNPFIYFQF